MLFLVLRLFAYFISHAGVAISEAGIGVTDVEATGVSDVTRVAGTVCATFIVRRKRDMCGDNVTDVMVLAEIGNQKLNQYFCLFLVDWCALLMND